MTQSPTATVIADALHELALYDDTDEAREACALAALLLDLDDYALPDLRSPE